MMEVHDPDYQQSVDSVKLESLIAVHDPLPAWLDTMTIAERIKSRMKQLGLSQAETARRAEISAQRFSNYLLKGRAPDKTTMASLARVLKTDVAALTGINETMIDAIEPILSRLFELEGLDPKRAAVLADLAAEALRLQAALDGEGDARTRSRMAAQAAWQTRSETEQD